MRVCVYSGGGKGLVSRRGGIKSGYRAEANGIIHPPPPPRPPTTTPCIRSTITITSSNYNIVPFPIYIIYIHIYCFHHFRHPHRRRFYKRCSTNSRPTPLLPPPPPLLPLVSLPLTPCRVTILLRVHPQRALSQCIHLIYAAVYVYGKAIL